MALNDTSFAQKLKAIFDAMDSSASDSPKDNQWLAAELAKAIDNQIKTADVNPGIEVAGGTESGGSLVNAKTAAKGVIS